MKPTCDICDGGGNFMATIGGLEYSVACPAAVHRARATSTPPATPAVNLDDARAALEELNRTFIDLNARQTRMLINRACRALGAVDPPTVAGGAAPPVPREPRTSHAEWFVSKLCRSGDHAICEAPKPCACSCHPRDPKTGELLAPPDEAKEPKR